MGLLVWFSDAGLYGLGLVGFSDGSDGMVVLVVVGLLVKGVGAVWLLIGDSDVVL